MRRVLIWSILTAIVAVILIGVGYWAYWNFFARFQPVTITQNQAEIQRHAFGLINCQLLFNKRRQLLANFVKLFVLQIRWQLTCDFFITQRHLFITHVQQPVGAGVG